jgi:hypothetical protein
MIFPRPSSIKGEVKKKQFFFGLKFSCFAAHLSEICSDYRAMSSVAGQCDPVVGFSLPAVFIAS